MSGLTYERKKGNQYTIAPVLRYTDATGLRPHELCYRRPGLPGSCLRPGAIREEAIEQNVLCAVYHLVSDMPVYLFTSHDSGQPQASPLIRVPSVVKRARTAGWKGPLAGQPVHTPRLL